ncbi:hypothetical protein ACOMHN_052044 [Nucella lapillus]
MERLAVCVAMLASLVDFAEGQVKCHDCTSWNPYCKDSVNKPFDSAVAVVECDLTSTCFLKKDANGLIHRGCADGWLGSRVDLTQTGCRHQRLPWMGEMLWCFCKEDFCNGGSVETLSNGTSPGVPAESSHQPAEVQDRQLIDTGGLEAEEEEEDRISVLHVQPEERKAEERKMEERKAEERKMEERKMEERKMEERKTEERKIEERKMEERKMEERKMDDRKTEERKTEERKTEEKQMEEIKVTVVILWCIDFSTLCC